MKYLSKTHARLAVRRSLYRSLPQLEVLEAKLAPSNLLSLGDGLATHPRQVDSPLWTAMDVFQDSPAVSSRIALADDLLEHSPQVAFDAPFLLNPAFGWNADGKAAANQPAALVASEDPNSSPGALSTFEFLATLENRAVGVGSLTGTGTHSTRRSHSWIPRAPMAEARSFFTATPLEDGRILVAGGYVQRRVLAGAEIYNPRTDSWTQTGALQTARAGNGAVLLPDGRVLIAGGLVYAADGSSTTLNSAEIYDPASGVWTPTGCMNVARVEPFLTLLNNGKVLAAGETRAAGPEGKSAEIYDPDTGQWTRVADMLESRSNQVQLALPDGRVLVAGGYSGAEPGDFLHASAEIYDPQTDTWTSTGDMTMPRADAEGVVLNDGRVLVTGGNTVLRPPTRTNTAEIYDPATGEWTRTSGAMSEAKVDHTITLLQDGRVLTTGGFLTHDIALSSADLYDPNTDTWTPVAHMSKSRGGHQALLLKHDRVLVVGGLNFDDDTAPEHGLASTELYRVAGRQGAGLPAHPGRGAPS